jgi:hypothetical protein
MAYLTAAHVVVTLNPEDIDRSPDGRIGIRTFPTVAFGNGALQYPALGIPQPALGKFGFNFAIKRVYIEQPANGFIYSFDRANHKLRIFLGAALDAVSANVVLPDHAHDLIILANNAGAGIQIIAAGANTANHAFVSNIATGDTIPGGNTANKGGVEIANMGTANVSFAGGTAAALTELDASAAPAPTTLYMEMVGK